MAARGRTIARKPAPVLALRLIELRLRLGPNALGNALGDSIAAANGQGSSNMPGPVSATERASIMGMFADSPGSGSNAALDYIAKSRWSGMSDTSAPGAPGQQYVDTYGGDVTPTAWRSGGISDHDLAVQRSVALANQPESIGSYVSGDPFRVDIEGTGGWKRAETLPDGTQVLKNSDGLRMVEQKSSGGAAPQVPGYEVSGSRTYRAVDGEDIFYSPAAAAQDATDTYAGNMDPRDIRGSFGYQSLLSRGLADAEASRSLDARIASGPSMRGWNPAIDGVKAAKDRALLNYLDGQGGMALGGVAASATMLASNNINAASMATDIARPIDSLIAPRGGAASQLSRVRGSRPIDLAQTYEADIRKLYGAVPFQQRTYTAFVNGQWVNGVADNVAVLNGRTTAIEAKYVENWDKSLRNPDSPNGGMPWAVVEQRTMLDQATKYSKAFEHTIYHTNSSELANHYSPLFEQAGITNFHFVITPAKP